MSVLNNILIVEDDRELREALVDTLALAGYQQSCAENGKQALTMLQNEKPSLIISDVNMPEMNGLSFLETLKKHHADIPVLLMTAFGNIADAVRAMRAGAADYLLKPFEPNDLVSKVEKYLPSQAEPSGPVVKDPRSKQLLALASKVASSDVSVLISGASGTGKEVLARYVHDNSSRADQPFVAINCAAIPENMLEATLFGYEKGAFTGAYKSHPGKFEQAQNGTLLLDEISEMDLSLQAKLLRVLQEREVERLGSQKTLSLNVRVLATTNRDLMEHVKAGNFREDLYYRLNVFPLHWIPLCERPMDIMPLAEYLLQKHAVASGRQIPTFSAQASEALQTHQWSGNAREMDNTIQRALILQSGETIEVDDLQLELNEPPAEQYVIKKPLQEKLSSDVQSHEFQLILDALNEVSGNRESVAKKLGISPRTLRYKLAKMREEGIEV